MNPQPVFPDNTTIIGDGTEAHPLVSLGLLASNVRTVRTRYVVQAGDLAAGFANIPVVFTPALP